VPCPAASYFPISVLTKTSRRPLRRSCPQSRYCSSLQLDKIGRILLLLDKRMVAWRKDANWEEVMKKRKCEELSTPIRRPRVTPRSLHVYNPHTSTIGTFTPPCKPKLPVQFSHSTTMHILNQHPSYTPPRTAVWCASGAEHGVRSGGVEGYGPSRLELFLGGGRKKMRRSIWTK